MGEGRNRAEALSRIFARMGPVSAPTGKALGPVRKVSGQEKDTPIPVRQQTGGAWPGFCRSPLRVAVFRRFGRKAVRCGSVAPAHRKAKRLAHPVVYSSAHHFFGVVQVLCDVAARSARCPSHGHSPQAAKDRGTHPGSSNGRAAPDVCRREGTRLRKNSGILRNERRWSTQGHSRSTGR